MFFSSLLCYYLVLKDTQLRNEKTIFHFSHILHVLPLRRHSKVPNIFILSINIFKLPTSSHNILPFICSTDRFSDWWNMYNITHDMNPCYVGSTPRKKKPKNKYIQISNPASLCIVYSVSDVCVRWNSVALVFGISGMPCEYHIYAYYQSIAIKSCRISWLFDANNVECKCVNGFFVSFRLFWSQHIQP